jgi:hypothetical protein
MAYVAGLLSDEELTELESRGWELEDCPVQLIPRNMPVDERGRMKMVWVDASIFEITNGPDREAGNTPQEGKAPSEVTVAESATDDKQASNSRND